MIGGQRETAQVLGSFGLMLSIPIALDICRQFGKVKTLDLEHEIRGRVDSGI